MLVDFPSPASGRGCLWHLAVRALHFIEVGLFMLKKLMLGFLIFYSIAAFPLNLHEEPAVRAYIERISKEHGFNETQLNYWFGQVKFNESVLAKMNPPPVQWRPRPPGVVISNPWYKYREIFVTEERVQRGVAFWKKNAQMLVEAEHRYGVPAEVIAGIIGVESMYGPDKGHYSVINTLSTLAFHFPRRSQYFTSELTQFLLLCRKEGWDPLEIKGSYAGALGIPQFMPSSYRSYAVDADNSGSSNLFDNDHDTILSVANYLQKNGWQKGKPVALPAKVTNDKYVMLANQNGKLRFTVKELHEYGLKPKKSVSGKTPAGVLFLQQPDNMEYWMTFPNFMVLKRYNANTRYAMMVYELGNIVKEASKKRG